jgi:hypothetical protein
MLLLNSKPAAGRAVAESGRAALLACPFCGSRAAFEPHVASGEIVRVACANARCAVRPATEYLLDEYLADLVRAWNGRAE